jgi:hypothetical protein
MSQKKAQASKAKKEIIVIDDDEPEDLMCTACFEPLQVNDLLALHIGDDYNTAVNFGHGIHRPCRRAMQEANQGLRNMCGSDRRPVEYITITPNLLLTRYMFRTGWQPSFSKEGRTASFPQAALIKSRFPMGQQNQLAPQAAFKPSRNQAPAVMWSQKPPLKRKRTQSPPPLAVAGPAPRLQAVPQQVYDEQEEDPNADETEWTPQEEWLDRRMEWGLSPGELWDRYTDHLAAYPPPPGVRLQPRVRPDWSNGY